MKQIDYEVSCPSCGWHPDGGKHWKCHCGHTWDVFSTGGRCPACFYHWEKTKCTHLNEGCNIASPHLEWYGNIDHWLAGELSFLKIIPKEQEK
jgi:hypothetical protein